MASVCIYSDSAKFYRQTFCFVIAFISQTYSFRLHSSCVVPCKYLHFRCYSKITDILKGSYFKKNTKLLTCDVILLYIAVPISPSRDTEIKYYWERNTKNRNDFVIVSVNIVNLLVKSEINVGKISFSLDWISVSRRQSLKKKGKRNWTRVSLKEIANE